MTSLEPQNAPPDKHAQRDEESHRVQMQVRALQTSIQELSSSLSSAHRRRQIDAVWLYVLFLIVVCAGAYAVISAARSSTDSKVELLESKVQRLEGAQLALNAELEAWKNIENNLMELDELIRSGQKEAAVERFTQLKHLKFSSLLLHLVERFKKEVAQEKFALGSEHYSKGSFRRADDALQLSLRYENEPDYLGRLLYLRGMSAVRLKRFAEAGLLLEQALNQGLSKKDRIQARFHRAYAYDRNGRRRMAREHYRLFQQRHPKHPYAKQAKVRYDALKRR